MKKVLLAEDDESVRALVAAILNSDGRYQFLEARNGVEALEVARREKPELILLDIRMPEMDGFEVCRHLKMDPTTRDMTIIMLTALAQEEDKVQSRQAGADGYFTKPFSPTALLKRVADNRTQQPSTAAVARVWERHKKAVVGRGAVLEQAVTALLDGNLSDRLRRRAEWEAHKLVGSVATFGFAEGSRLAREIEQMLQAGSALGQMEVQRLSELVMALLQELKGTPKGVPQSG